ncbi:hypothetical protein SAMN05421866_1289 [Chryseobacterium oranimense]|uniref:Uncharacterized protein n=1 Tax=Chryseobacterium oranimense TaxID=421058 RepID=A0A1M5M0R5_9FLAO|nr:hypothetical protein [Chryseobacterium oranimense]CEJ71040.1 hypothetical protein BN1195_03379 [Chryseobacterium oranimense G311]SHG70944.1 hypothetical protein SAMN05421866_1289 [Chryseobacterium oranimense]
MKKLTVILGILAGIGISAQSSLMVINNYSAYDAEGRFMTVGSAGMGSSQPYMYALPNPPYSVYTIPAGGYTKYDKFDNTGSPNPIPIPGWNYIDPLNSANTGNYPYNHPIITAVTPIDEWMGFAFRLTDPTGYTYDTFEVGDPILSNGFLSSSQTGPNTTVSADWFTITTPGGLVTYFQIY